MTDRKFLGRNAVHNVFCLLFWLVTNLTLPRDKLFFISLHASVSILMKIYELANKQVGANCWGSFEKRLLYHPWFRNAKSHDMIRKVIKSQNNYVSSHRDSSAVCGRQGILRACHLCDTIELGNIRKVSRGSLSICTTIPHDKLWENDTRDF